LKFIRFWFPVFVYSGIIFWVSSLPNLDAKVDIKHFDKVLHIIEYVPLGLLLSRAFCCSTDRLNNKIILILSLLLASVYGLSDEYHQSFVLGRDSSVLDVFADSIGSAIGAFGYIIFNNKSKV